ncbi:MAG: peptidylprolyl isomerase [Anaerolineales bacterium]
MSKSSRRRAPKKQNSNWLVYAIAAVLLAGVVYIGYNLLVPHSGAKQWAAAPAMQIDVTKNYTAHIKTEKGTIDIQLLPQAAPITVNNFVFLARQRYYDGVTFHRVLPNFMAQGGDPTGTGSGGPGYFIPNENSSAVFDKAGLLAMANSGKDRNGSQFFITFGPQPNLNGGYTIFGQVIAGMDVVQSITLRDPDTHPTTPGDKITTITIDEN